MTHDFGKTLMMIGLALVVAGAVIHFGGKFLAAVGYRDAKNTENSDQKYKRWNAALGYTYAFSKRTNVYSFVGYAQEKDKSEANKGTPSVVQAGVGLVHKF